MNQAYIAVKRNMAVSNEFCCFCFLFFEKNTNMQKKCENVINKKVHLHFSNVDVVDYKKLDILF